MYWKTITMLCRIRIGDPYYSRIGLSCLSWIASWWSWCNSILCGDFVDVFCALLWPFSFQVRRLIWWSMCPFEQYLKIRIVNFKKVIFPNEIQTYYCWYFQPTVLENSTLVWVILHVKLTSFGLEFHHQTKYLSNQNGTQTFTNFLRGFFSENQFVKKSHEIHEFSCFDTEKM